MMGTYDQIVQLISTVGFPIVVSGYCLFTLNKTMNDLTLAVNSLVEVIKKGDD